MMLVFLSIHLFDFVIFATKKASRYLLGSNLKQPVRSFRYGRLFHEVSGSMALSKLVSILSSFASSFLRKR